VFEGMGVTGAAIGTLIASAWMMIHYSFYLNKLTMIKDNGGIISAGFDKTMLQTRSVYLYQWAFKRQ
jgi:Na+-driven multidrug efflux pump